MRTWLREIRKEKKMLQREVANPIGISSAYYTFIEKGKRRPSVETAKKIAAVLGFEWTKFFEDEATQRNRSYAQLPRLAVSWGSLVYSHHG